MLLRIIYPRPPANKVVVTRGIAVYSRAMTYQYSIDVLPEEDGKGFYVVVPALPGCFSQGRTVEEAQKNIAKAIKLHIKMLKKRKRFTAQEGLSLHAVVEVAA